MIFLWVTFGFVPSATQLSFSKLQVSSYLYMSFCSLQDFTIQMSYQWMEWDVKGQNWKDFVLKT